MLVDERQARVLERINDVGKVSAGDLSAEFGISEDTIRRDLRELSARGLCRRVYGGALRVSPASGNSAERRGQDTSRKQALGARLAGLIAPGQFAFIDAGSTNLAAARAIPAGLKATIATHDPVIAATLATRDDLDLIVIGGRIDPVVGAALGVEAARAVALMRPDLLLLGACALDAEAGAAVFHAEDAAMKRLLVERARSVATAMLAEKLGTAAPFAIGPAELVDDLVLEADTPARLTDAFAGAGLRLHRCGPGGAAA